MCQLLGMNCAAPTDFSFSFKGFCQRGGATDIHAHGFGLGIYEGRGLRCFLDTLPAAESPIAKMVQNYPIRTYVSAAVDRCISLILRNNRNHVSQSYE
jgi:predicted glutamine amidotransferase